MGYAETNTFEIIMDRMLARVDSSMDKREGSIIYDALAPAAFELAQAYVELDTVQKNTYADTATYEYLELRAKERGLTPYPASAATFNGTITFINSVEPIIGTKFQASNYTYTLTQVLWWDGERLPDGTSLGKYHVILVCEQTGPAPNSYVGALIPVDYVADLYSATLDTLRVSGEDKEDVEAFRLRYFDSFLNQAYGGNIAQYKEWVNAITGVGGCKISRTSAAQGQVNVVVQDGSYYLPSTDLVQLVQNTLCPNVEAWEGVGLAPIGHAPVVDAVTGVTINLTMTITYKSGYSWSSISAQVGTSLGAYTLALNKLWASNDNLIVRLSAIETFMLAIEGVQDVSGIQINGSGSNLTLGINEITIRGSVNGY